MSRKLVNRQHRHTLPKVLFEIGKLIGSAEGLDGLLTQVSRLVTQLVNARACSILLLDADKQRLLGRAAYGLRRENVGTIAFKLGEGIAGWVAQHGESVLLADVTQDPRFVLLPGRDHKIRSLACVPIQTHDESIGVLTTTALEVGAFTADDIELLEFVATTMALDVQNMRLRRLAMTDALTGVFNREFLARELPEAIAHARANKYPFSIAMLDIDHFKQVNDTHGHAIGDGVLVQVAQRLGSAIRDIDTLIRYGGEEFLVILPKITIEASKAIAERMRLKIEANPIIIDGIRIEVRISAGVAEAVDSETTSELIRRADAALYTAKNVGRNRVAAAHVPALKK